MHRLRSVRLRRRGRCSSSNPIALVVVDINIKLQRVGFGSVQRLVVVLQVHLHVCCGCVGGGGCEDSCKASDLVFVLGFV
jgi:hypothetical protein